MELLGEDVKESVRDNFRDAQPKISCLHPNDAIDEEDKCNEQGYIWQGLEGLDEGVEQLTDGLTLGQQLYQPQGSAAKMGLDDIK